MVQSDRSTPGLPAERSRGRWWHLSSPAVDRHRINTAWRAAAAAASTSGGGKERHDDKTGQEKYLTEVRLLVSLKLRRYPLSIKIQLLIILALLRLFPLGLCFIRGAVDLRVLTLRGSNCCCSIYRVKVWSVVFFIWQNHLKVASKDVVTITQNTHSAFQQLNKFYSETSDSGLIWTCLNWFPGDAYIIKWPVPYLSR